MKLPKSARLHHRSLQERLFNEGSKLHEFPLKMMWNVLSAEELEKNFRNRVPDLIGPVQVLVSVPKKKRRKAVDRVLMRRRIREAFRLNRQLILDFLGDKPEIRTLSIALIYMKEANAPYSVVEERLRRLIEKLKEKIEASLAEDKAENAESGSLAESVAEEGSGVGPDDAGEVAVGGDA